MSTFLSRFLRFDRMVTPVIIRTLYWIALGGIALVTMFGVVGSLASLWSKGAPSALGGALLTIISGAVTMVLVRIYCELLLLFFGMHDSLRAIEANTRPVPRDQGHD